MCKAIEITAANLRQRMLNEDGIEVIILAKLVDPLPEYPQWRVPIIPKKYLNFSL